MDDLIAALAGICGEAGVEAGAATRDRSATWGTGQRFAGKAVVCPRSTDQVAAVMRLCHQARQPVVPFGGLTNLVHACRTTADDIAVSFEKMDRVEDIDVRARTMTAQAGVTLQAAQDAAEAAGLLFPIDIGARGECMLGGNVATNAGGTRVIRYGMTRDSVLGLEAVLADGTVVSSMNRFLKNNSGFDLKQLFIGTEGTLGLVTRIVFRLQVLPRSHNVALVAFEDYSKVVSVLNRLQERLGALLCGYEVMWQSYYREVVRPLGKHAAPVPPDYPFYAIVEATGTDAGTDDAVFQAVLTEVVEAGEVADGSIAKSAAEIAGIWAIRHEVEWIVRDAWVFDVSLPIADAADYSDRLTTGLHGFLPAARVVTFGHLGDNNIHISVLCDGDRAALTPAVEKQVYEALIPYGGAVSAEHGIGVDKIGWLPISRTAEEIGLMRTLKKALDPLNILNPGKVVGS